MLLCISDESLSQGAGSQDGLGTSAESVDEELARLDKARVKAVFTKISREPVGIERALDNLKRPTVLESPELGRAVAIGQLRTVNDVPLGDRACGIHEEKRPPGRSASCTLRQNR